MRWQYIKRFPAWLVVILLRYPAAVIAVIFFSSKDKLSLTRWKRLETIDNDLTGDSGWKTEHIGGTDPLKRWNRIRWLWRNGGNRYCYEVLGVPHNNIPEWAFEKRYKLPLWGERFLEFRYGWALDGPQKGLCKYVFNPRGKTKP